MLLAADYLPLERGETWLVKLDRSSYPSLLPLGQAAAPGTVTGQRGTAPLPFYYVSLYLVIQAGFYRS